MFTSISAFAMGIFYFILGLSTSQNFPAPLGAKNERELFAKMRDGDENARTKLIEHNLRLVAHIVRKYYFTYKNQDDLISIGSIGLVKAIDSFDASNGARFATYGAKCIQNEILMYFRSQKKLANEVSINETIDIDRDGNPLTYEDIICVEDTIAEDIDRKLHTKRAMRLINDILTERERIILVLRYGLNNKPAMAQRDVAKLLKISRSYVSRIEKGALEKLLKNFKKGE
ncbi:MAG: sigma-70 family RNA polymerase sigma factor [Ruminococcaceae bacterium]|nr:sigma-70 family RNA polymerase sigma factor [Oscillospiraceae bacterium]